MSAVQFPQAPKVRYKAFSIEELGLLESSGQGSLQYITRVARRIFSVRTSLIGIFEDGEDRQILVSGLGLPEDWEEAGWIPLSKSFSQFVRLRAKPLAVDDKDAHELGGKLDDRDTLPYRSYLGAPIFAPSGESLGALCVVDTEVRHWTPEDLAVLEDLAHCVTDAILLRAALLTSQQLQRDLEASLLEIRQNIALHDTLVAAFTEPDKTSEERLQSILEAGCRALNMSAAAVTRVDGPRTRVVTQFRRDGAPPDLSDDDVDNSNTLTAHLLSGQEMVWFCGPQTSKLAGRTAFDGSEPECFIGAPLLLDGLAYGTLEFHGGEIGRPPDFEKEAWVVGVIAMFTITQLEVFAQFDRLKRTEDALLQYILDLRAAQDRSLSTDI